LESKSNPSTVTDSGTYYRAYPNPRTYNNSSIHSIVTTAMACSTDWVAYTDARDGGKLVWLSN
jgi:hypothetical protein